MSTVEIYLRDCTLERATAWASSVLGCQLSTPLDAGESTAYAVPGGALVFTPNIESQPILSVWFNTSIHPWATNEACARAASKNLGCSVLTELGNNFLLEVTGNKERQVPNMRFNPDGFAAG
jgi:hypothetical protein